MRLTCPNCGVEYEVPEGLVPPDGKHVQCTNCHTRWFVRAAARPMPSEDQIIGRVEALSPRPRPVAVPSGMCTSLASESEPAPKPAAEVEDIAEDAPVGAPPNIAPTVAANLERDAPSAADAPPELGREAPVEPSLRGAARLELGARPPVPAPPLPVRDRFRRGFLLALIAAALAMGAYVWRDELSARLPPAAPALEGYGAAVDDAREWMDRRLAGLRGDPAP